MYDYSEEITDYIYQQMSELQREAFELRLEHDKELAAEVARQQEMLETVRAISLYKEAMEDPHYEEAARLADEIIESHEKDALKKRKTIRLVVRRILYSAASIAGLVLVSRSPVKNRGTKKVHNKLRGNVGIPTNLTQRFGKIVVRGIDRIQTMFRKR